MALVSDVRVPRICLSPTAGKSSGAASEFRFDVVDSILHPHPLIHGRRSNDVSRLALLELSDRDVPHSSSSQLSRSIRTYTRSPSWPAAVESASRRPTRVCIACPTELCYAVMRPPSLHAPARLPDTIISTNEASPTPSDRAGGTALMLKHSPRAAISGRCWMPLHVGRSAPVRPKPGSDLAEPGPEGDRSHCTVNQQGGGAGGRDIRPALVLFSPVRPGSGWVNF